jgi:phosphoesterase RecJ-like protein
MHQILSRLQHAKRVAVFTHQRPDPDALGSQAAAAFLKDEHAKVCAIDHHLSRDDLGPVIFADTDAASTTEILFDLAKLSNTPLTPEIAQPLMAGLVGDTGWFRFDSVTQRTHTMAGELAALCPSDALYEKLQQTETKTKLALIQRALASVQWHAIDKAAVMVL